VVIRNTQYSSLPFGQDGEPFKARGDNSPILFGTCPQIGAKSNSRRDDRSRSAGIPALENRHSLAPGIDIRALVLAEGRARQYW
jgi:hypothetical protein